ncbi:MAG: PQQ-dependent sugar dehydrogenase, partial [Pseudomonadota bacterium]
IISTETEAEGMAQPAVNWVPSIAPSGMVLYSGDIHPEWNGDLLLGAMNGPDGQKMVRVDLDEVGNVVGVEDFFTDAQIPFRDVEVGPDGHIYLVTAELDGRLFRVDLGF